MRIKFQLQSFIPLFSFTPARKDHLHMLSLLRPHADLNFVFIPTFSLTRLSRLRTLPEGLKLVDAS
jgi:hypothetical protein